MATHSSILAWRIPWTEELGGLQSMELQESDTTELLNHHHHHNQASSFRRLYIMGTFWSLSLITLNSCTFPFLCFLSRVFL